MKNIIKNCMKLKQCLLENIESVKNNMDLENTKYRLVIVEKDMNVGDRMYVRTISKTFGKYAPFVEIVSCSEEQLLTQSRFWNELYPNTNYSIIFIGNGFSEHILNKYNLLDLDNSALNADRYMPITSEIIYELTKQSIMKFDKTPNIMMYGVGKHTNRMVHDKLVSQGISLYVVNSKTDRQSDLYKNNLQKADIVVASTGVAEQFDGEYNEESIYISPTIVKGKSDFKFGGLLAPNVTQVMGEYSIGTLTNLLLVYRFLEKNK